MRLGHEPGPGPAVGPGGVREERVTDEHVAHRAVGERHRTVRRRGHDVAADLERVPPLVAGVREKRRDVEVRADADAERRVRVVATGIRWCRPVPTATVVAMELRPYDDGDRAVVVALSLRAWEPVFDSLRDVLGPSGVFGVLHPDWRDSQRRAVGSVLDDEAMTVWTAVLDGAVVGFAAATAGEEYGEIVMLAVDPPAQRRGAGGALTTAALDWIAGQGVEVAMVETGGDPGHAPARRVYERAGFTALPVTRYFRRSASPPPPPAR